MQFFAPDREGHLMRNVGVATTALGLVILFFSFSLETAPEGTYNIGLLQEQMMIFQLGSVAVLAGVLLFLCGAMMLRLEGAGILPPQGVVAQVEIAGRESEGA
jgi:hypothetical protein